MRTPHIILSSASSIQGLLRVYRERIERMYTRWVGLGIFLGRKAFCVFGFVIGFIFFDKRIVALLRKLNKV